MRRRDLLTGALLLLTSASLARAQSDAVAEGLTQGQFDDWVANLRAKALDAGVTAPTWDAGLTGLTPDPVVIARKAAAAETNLTLSAYVQHLLQGRGQKARAKYASVPRLAEIERSFGVPGGVLVAFWGMESDYGANIGDRDVLRATATHGAAGSSGADWTAEFIAALKILQSGVVPRQKLVGSYAGALGQTQLMPTRYLLYGVDFDGDGRIDVWSDPLDALASAAQHLTKASGWKAGESWLEEVTLPADFDLAKVEVEVTASHPDEWAAMGVKRVQPGPWSAADKAEAAKLMLPAGIAGPAFLAFPNYDAFMAYNRSLPYAIGVGLLAKFAQGDAPTVKPWPSEAALTREARMAAQAGLARLGYYDGRIDGDMGSKSRKALRDWQLATHRPRDGHLTADQAAALST
jgi:lytic murein transglycosylase